MRYRLTGDYRQMSGFSVRFAEQYFDEALPLGDSEVFVDCGGFDGDTVLQFCARTGSHKHIFCFEPSPANFNRAQQRLAEVGNLSLIPLGVSDRKGSLCFDPGGGSASYVTLEGSISVDVVTIDEYIPDRVSYIKMDLEGWELPALKGGRRHITEDHPKLAIAVYHKASDFWQIPEYVFSIRNDYQVYLRHYSEGWSESVMYFVPS
jgi:FkbM family methyltransferase